MTDAPAMHDAPLGTAHPLPASMLGAKDLAELITAFNDVTARVQQSHDALAQETHRLKAELARTNRQLRRSQQLAALGEMAAGIAHEIRNPLGSIQLYAGMLIEDLADRPEQLDIARKISAAVHGLDAIVTDVLAFAREIHVRPMWMDVASLLNSAIEACALQLSSRDIAIDMPDEAMESLDVECDPSLVRLALVNVVRNAVEAMSEDTDERLAHRLSLTAEASRIQRGDTDEPAVALRIRDTGSGLPPEVMERMFNPFFTTRQTGTGLGLAIVHRIIDAHSGHITIRNRAPRSRGADVRIVLPRCARIHVDTEVIA
ncbi:MAG: hypothetical protein KAS72_01100 [Phycisphaerales bacterium]|nr:hypothetical protein [Phycisphaerales bacterium]